MGRKPERSSCMGELYCLLLAPYAWVKNGKRTASGKSRMGTLSQNGYGTHWHRTRAGTQVHSRVHEAAHNKRAGSTLRTSRAVPHLSTIRALLRLTSEF